MPLQVNPPSSGTRGNWFDCPVLSASEIAATVNSGNGTGLLCPELPAPVRETPEQLDEILDAYAKFVTSANEMVPASKGKILMYGATTRSKAAPAEIEK